MSALKVGDRFGAFNTDSKGTITGVSAGQVFYVFDHAPEIEHSRNTVSFLGFTFTIANIVPNYIAHAIAFSTRTPAEED